MHDSSIFFHCVQTEFSYIAKGTVIVGWKVINALVKLSRLLCYSCKWAPRRKKSGLLCVCSDTSCPEMDKHKKCNLFPIQQTLLVSHLVRQKHIHSVLSLLETVTDAPCSESPAFEAATDSATFCASSLEERDINRYVKSLCTARHDRWSMPRVSGLESLHFKVLLSVSSWLRSFCTCFRASSVCSRC